MSLLLQALQKAAKSREGDADVAAPLPATDLALEPTSPAPRNRQEASALSATPAQASTLMQAASVPAFDPLDYAREHYMITFVALAFLFAVAYGTYVYVQINHPFRGSVTAPTLVAVTPPRQAPVPDTPAISPSAKISGLHGGASATASGPAEAGATGLAAPAVVPAATVAPEEQRASGIASPRSNAAAPATGRAIKNEKNLDSERLNTTPTTSPGKRGAPASDSSDAI